MQMRGAQRLQRLPIINTTVPGTDGQIGPECYYVYRTSCIEHHPSAHLWAAAWNAEARGESAGFAMPTGGGADLVSSAAPPALAACCSRASSSAASAVSSTADGPLAPLGAAPHRDNQFMIQLNQQ